MGQTVTQEPLMKLKDLLSLVNVTDKLKQRIVELGGKFEAAECNAECLGHEMGQIMTEAIGSMMGPMDSEADADLDTDSDDKDATESKIALNSDTDSSNKTINIDIGNVDGQKTDSSTNGDANARSEL